MSPIDDISTIKVEFTEQFGAWLAGLRDGQGAALITARLLRLRRGHWGDVKPVGEGVSELRIAYGPGYRLYVTKRNDRWVLVLGGGDKDSQSRDISHAKQLARELKDGG